MSIGDYFLSKNAEKQKGLINFGYNEINQPK